MHVIARPRLIEFYALHPDSRGDLEAWFHEAKRAEWRTPAEIKERYPDASILKHCRVVFNICRNKYRLVVSIIYGGRTVYIRFIGTHSEYDRINAETV